MDKQVHNEVDACFHSKRLCFAVKEVDSIQTMSKWLLRKPQFDEYLAAIRHLKQMPFMVKYCITESKPKSND